MRAYTVVGRAFVGFGARFFFLAALTSALAGSSSSDSDSETSTGMGRGGGGTSTTTATAGASTGGVGGFHTITGGSSTESEAGDTQWLMWLAQNTTNITAFMSQSLSYSSNRD